MSTDEDRAYSTAVTDQVASLVFGSPTIRAACERINTDIAEAIALLLANGVDPHTAASAIGGQTTGTIILAIANHGIEEAERNGDRIP